ncbi:sodium:melibiose symporter [Opitutaceae bacterium EW11]|nr:sodium:melibiose symporter [Opitutaceae bacterium EW11]
MPSPTPLVAGPAVTRDSTAFETRDKDKVSFWEKTALGAGYLAKFYGDNGVKSLTIPFYQMVLKVDPALLGLVLAIPRLWDAITDPIVGMISDNCRSRFGRRKPIIVLGALLQALAFGAIWMVPTGLSQRATVTYLAVTLIVFYTCFSIFSVPLMSLTYEMTADYKERTRVSAFGGFFGKIGELTYSWVFWAANLAVFGSVMHGMRAVGWTIALCIMGLVGMIPGLLVRERQFQRAARQPKVHFVPALKASFGNRAFLVLIGFTICQVIAGMLSSNIDYYLLVYHMNAGDIVEGTKWKGVLSAGFAIVGIGAIYPVNLLANRCGKRTTLFIVFGMNLVGGVAKWFIYNPGNPWKILLDPLLCGPAWTAVNVLQYSMLADVCDDDELRHGLRREGMLGSLFSWIQKTGFALAFFGAGLALNFVGFNAALGGAQSHGTILGMRLMLAGSITLWSILAIGLLCFYPISKKRAYETRDLLEARRGSSTSA